MPRKPQAEFEITARDQARAVLNQVDRSLQGLNRTAVIGTRALGGLTGAYGLSELAQVIDRYNALSTRIRTATKDTGDYAQVQRELISLAAQTGAGLEATVDTFQALSRVRDDIGATNEQMIALTRTVQQLGVIGGSSQEALRNGLRQFNQALAGGVFRAEEFNSIVENTPEIAKRIADGLGVTQGQLRQLVIDGKLFADDVMNTLLEQAPEISDEFGKIPVTLDRAFSDLGVSIGTAASKVDEMLGATTGVANAITDIARTIRLLGGTASAAEKTSAELTVLRGSAILVQEQLEGLLDAGAGEDSRAVQNLRAGLAEIEQKIAATQTKLTELASAGGGTVGGGDDVRKIDTKAIEAEKKQAAAELQVLARFNEQVLDDLRTRQELELQQLIEFAAAVTAEEERLRADELARLAGFEDEKARLKFEREEETFQAVLEGRQRRFEEELAQELGFQDVRAQTLAEAEEEFERRKIEARFRNNDLARKASLDLAKFEKANAVDRTKFVLDQAALMTQGLSQSSRALFNLNKAAAIANAVVNTAEGVTAALKLGPAGIPLAALIGAQGAAQIATIASTQFGGAGSGLTSSGPGTGVPSLATENPLRAIPLVTSDQRNQSQITLRIESSGRLAGALADDLAIEVDQGDVVIVTERSRQAIEIRG